MNMKLFLRDEHFVEVVEREVLNKKRKALLISGNAHMRRCCLAGPLGTTARVEKTHPGMVFVALPHQGFQERNEELEARLASWPKPGLEFNDRGIYGRENSIVFGDMGSIYIFRKKDGTLTSSFECY